MSIAFKIIGSVLVVVGGIYVLSKTQFGKNMCQKVKDSGGKIKKSFSEGYTETVEVS